jgi:hypothetical protein
MLGHSLSKVDWHLADIKSIAYKIVYIEESIYIYIYVRSGSTIS